MRRKKFRAKSRMTLRTPRTARIKMKRTRRRF